MRLIGLLGVGIAVAGTATWLVAPISMPEAAAALAAHYEAHRTALIIAGVLVVSGSALTAAWYVALAGAVSRSARGQLLGRIGVVGMAIQIAAFSVAFTFFAAVAYRQPSAQLAQLETDAGWLLVSLAGGPVTSVAILAFALSLRLERLGGRWLMPFSAVAAAAHLVVASSFADAGFFAPRGGIEYVVPLIYQAWIAAAGLSLARGPRPA